MKSSKPNIVKNKIDEVEPGGEPVIQKDDNTPPKDAPPAKAEGDFDEFGYPKVEDTPGEEKPPGDEPPPKKEPEEIKDPATGYGKEPPKVEDDVVVEPPAEPPPPPDDYDKSLEGLPKEEMTKAKDFMKKNNMSVEQAKAYADMRKTEIAQQDAEAKTYAKQIEINKQKIRAGWDKELRTDPVFGGDKFLSNIQQVDKVLQDFMPNLKKTLTEQGTMLPPYLMRDFAKLAEHLYKGDTLVQGDPGAQSKKETVEDDGTAFYNLNP